MTTQLPNTEYTLEDLHEIAYRGSYDDMQRSLARALLAVYEQEPVATLDVQSGREDGKTFALAYSSAAHKLPDDVYFLYTHPAPELSAIVDRLNLSGYEHEDGEVTPQNAAAVVDILLQQLDESVQGRDTHPAPSIPTMPAGLHPDTQKLVADFSTALAEKLYKAQLKYGYSDNWKRDGWAEECLQHFQQHIVKGDPRDVAAYCAFMWFHGWSTALPCPSISNTKALPGSTGATDLLPPPSAPTALPMAPSIPAVPECFQRLLHHAEGMSMGIDWNNGTAAGHHREKMLEAVQDCCAMLNGGKS